MIKQSEQNNWDEFLVLGFNIQERIEPEWIVAQADRLIPLVNAFL